MTDIVIEQRISAPPATVYRFLTESDKWVQWQGATASFEPRDGGLFSVVMPNGMQARGQFTELVPHSRVVFTWGWVDRPGIPPGSTVVSIELRTVETGTLLVLTHSDLPDEEASEHMEGWRAHLPRLAEVVTNA